MKLHPLHKLLGSGFGTGYIPFASGTWGSLAAFLIYWIPGFERPAVILPAILLACTYGVWVAGRFESVYGKDPSECTIDEVAGMWISLLFLPKSLILSGIVFLAWRVLDIVKPFPAGRAESLPAGWGVMADDVVSALYALAFGNALVYVSHLFNYSL